MKYFNWLKKWGIQILPVQADVFYNMNNRYTYTIINSSCVSKMVFFDWAKKDGFGGIYNLLPVKADINCNIFNFTIINSYMLVFFDWIKNISVVGICKF